jgi:uncharacterized protein
MAMKIGRDDVEALLSGAKDLRSYFELDPLAGTIQVFGVKASSNPDYLIRAMYETYEKTLNKKLAVQMMRKLYRSVGLGASGLRTFLEKQGVSLKPSEFLTFVFLLQHQQGWGAPVTVVDEGTRIRLTTARTFESQVMKDWKMKVCGIHAGWIEGVLDGTTGKNWVCEETMCHAAGDDRCEFIVEQREVTWNERAVSIWQGDRSITEFLEYRPLEGRINLIDEPVVIIPRIIFTTLMGSMSKIVGEAAAGGVITYRAYMELGSQYVEFCRKKGVSDPATLVNMALALFTQMGWFKIERMDWDETKKEKTIVVANSAEADAFGKSGKAVCHCTNGLLAGFISTAYQVKVQAKEVKCRSKGDEYCEFVIRDKPREHE